MIAKRPRERVYASVVRVGSANAQGVKTDHLDITAGVEMIVTILRGHGIRNDGPRTAVVFPDITVLTELYSLAIQHRRRCWKAIS